ncbi:MAG: hypothetical protein ACT6Q8_18075 [Niveispirillum sp.]|uniref:hypothetical protein n=1 Tax=Niveispirillum sp. TaxID=1917217 RepID=UPI0040355BD4
MSDGLNIPVSEKMLKDIGSAIVHWTYLEMLLDLIIWRILNIDSKHGVLITGRLDSRPKCEMLFSLINMKERPKEEIDKLRLAIKSVSDASGDRNLLAHAAIVKEDENHEIHLLTFRGKNAGKRNPVNEKIIEAMSERIKNARTSLWQWAINYGYLDIEFR